MKKYSSITTKEMSDSGQALALILLILALILGGRGWLWLAVIALVLNMASPRLFRWFAFLWLNFSHYLSAVVSRIVMAGMFFLLVLPIGYIRRRMGRDAMALRKWRQGDESVFVERNHTFVGDDLRHPY